MVLGFVELLSTDIYVVVLNVCCHDGSNWWDKSLKTLHRATTFVISYERNISLNYKFCLQFAWTQTHVLSHFIGTRVIT